MAKGKTATGPETRFGTRLRTHFAGAKMRLGRRRSTAPASAAVTTHHRSVYILPTKAGIGYGLMLLATLLGALNYQNNLGLLLTFLMIALALVGMHHCWFQLLELGVQARDGAPVFAGETARFPVTLVEQSGKPRPQLTLVGAAPVALAAGGESPVMLPRTAGRRGALALDRVVLETRYPFGLFRAWTVLRPRAEVLVYPQPAARAPRAPMLPQVARNDRGDRGSGAEDFIGLRPYRPGDPPRRLDWKAFARERGVMVKHFGGDQCARVWLDWDALAAADIERRLSLLARQVLDADACGHSYGLRLPDISIAHGRGGRHRHRCLAALARFRPAAAGHHD